MEMYQIRYFLAVCDALNFTRASEKCFVSQPSLTKAIQKLEDGLGGRLFDRTKTHVHLTELGRVMQPHLAQLYSSARQAKEQAKSFLSGQNPKLALGIMCTISMEPLAGMFAYFQNRHPSIELHFDEGNLEQTTDALDKGDLDAALIASPHEFPKRFEAIPLYHEKFVVACPANHRLLAKKTVALADLDGECYLTRSDCEYAVYICELLGERGVKLDVRHTTGREDWVQAMIRAGMGIAFMPENTCAAAHLSSCQIAGPRIERDVQILTLAHKEKSPALQTFIDQATHYDWRRAADELRERAV